MRHTKEQGQHRDLVMFLIRMLFSEGKTQSLGLCNASVTTARWQEIRLSAQ